MKAIMEEQSDIRTRMSPDGLVVVISLCLALETHKGLDSIINKAQTKLYGSGAYISPTFKTYLWQLNTDNSFSMTTEEKSTPASQALLDQVKSRAIIAIKNTMFDVSIFDLTANME